MRWPRTSAAVVTSMLVALVSLAHAQELEPRAYANTPVGMNFLLVGYGYSEGSVATDPALPVKDFNVNVHSAVLAYVRSIDVWGMSGKAQVILPYAWLSARATVAAEQRDREVSGFGDPMLRLSLNFFGAPALSLPEFASYEQDLIVGASLRVTAPGGQYDPDKLVNIGTNRWSFKPEVGISKAYGALTLEMIAGVSLFTDNDDFFGGKTRAQAPLYSLQGHVIYHFPRGLWAALDATYYAGGRTTLDGVAQDTRLESIRVGLTLAIPVDRHFSVKVYGNTGVYSRGGASARLGKDFDVLGMAWQYRWGGGL
jgi:hypothetical protein